MAGSKLFPARKKRRTPRIEIIPMVDVMFLLLVFYILSSLALHNQKGINVNLPPAASGDPAAVTDDFVISVTPDGQFFLNKDKVEEARFSAALQAWATGLPGGIEAAKKVNVIINADSTAQHRYVVEAMDELRKLGVLNFTISTEPVRAKK